MTTEMLYAGHKPWVGALKQLSLGNKNPKSSEHRKHRNHPRSLTLPERLSERDL